MPVAQQICTPLSADLWDNLSPQASSVDVQNPHEACGYSYNGCIHARRPAHECPFFVHSETFNFELMWRRKYKKKNPSLAGGDGLKQPLFSRQGPNIPVSPAGMAPNSLSYVDKTPKSHSRWQDRPHIASLI